MACSPLQGHEFAALPERDRSSHSAYAANFVAETAAAADAVAARLARDGVHDVGPGLGLDAELGLHGYSPQLT